MALICFNYLIKYNNSLTDTVAEERFSELGAVDRSNSSPAISLDEGGAATAAVQTPITDGAINGDRDYGVDDVMMLSKIKKRLSLVESELELTKQKFSTTQASLQVGQILLQKS